MTLNSDGDDDEREEEESDDGDESDYDHDDENDRDDDEEEEVVRPSVATGVADTLKRAKVEVPSGPTPNGHAVANGHGVVANGHANSESLNGYLHPSEPPMGARLLRARRLPITRRRSRSMRRSAA